MGPRSLFCLSQSVLPWMAPHRRVAVKERSLNRHSPRLPVTARIVAAAQLGAIVSIPPSEPGGKMGTNGPWGLLFTGSTKK